MSAVDIDTVGLLYASRSCSRISLSVTASFILVV